jgi:transcriptional regulator with XRE-family HTH domain
VKNQIGLKIKRLREEKNETQDTLANLLGVKRTMISHYEQGVNEISLDKLLVLAKHFKIPLSELTGEVTNVSNTGEESPEDIVSLKKEVERLRKKVIELQAKLLEILEKK